MKDEKTLSCVSIFRKGWYWSWETCLFLGNIGSSWCDILILSNTLPSFWPTWRAEARSKWSCSTEERPNLNGQCMNGLSSCKLHALRLIHWKVQEMLHIIRLSPLPFSMTSMNRIWIVLLSWLQVRSQCMGRIKSDCSARAWRKQSCMQVQSKVSSKSTLPWIVAGLSQLIDTNRERKNPKTGVSHDQEMLDKTGQGKGHRRKQEDN